VCAGRGVDRRAGGGGVDVNAVVNLTLIDSFDALVGVHFALSVMV
jgi:hypothetical protein